VSLRDNVLRALGVGAMAFGNDLWSHGPRWGDAFDVVGVVLVWLLLSTLRDRRRARPSKRKQSALPPDLGEFGKPGADQGSGIEAR
jgi:hypothetical protein